MKIVSKKMISNLMSKQLHQNMMWSFFGVISASLIMFFVQIIAGRELGPEQYGIASFVLLAANTLRPFFINGSDVVLAKELAHSNENQYSSNISSALVVMIMSLYFCGLVVFLILFFCTEISKNDMLLEGAIFSLIIILGIKFFFEGIARGLSLFKKQSFYRLTESIIVLIFVVLLLMIFLKQTYISFIASIAVGASVIMVLYGKIFFKYFKIKYINIRKICTLFKYGSLFAINSLIFSFVYLSDRLIINGYLGGEILGIYSAYALVTITVANLVASVISNVFFVHVAKKRNKMHLVKKIDYIFKTGFLPTVIFLCIFSSVSILLYGSEYKFDIGYVVLFSVLGGLSIFGSLYGPIITTYSNRVFARMLLIFCFRIVLLILYYYMLISNNILSINLILFGLIFDYILALIIVRYIIWRYVK